MEALLKNPAYREVVTGRTGHAEVLQIQYDDSLVSFAKLLEVFFATHDPTTLNRQGNDVGTQYRSAIFYHDMKQKESAMATIEALQTSDAFADQIVTEVTAFEVFYPAEDYHNDYFASHGHEPYCSLVIAPKVKKFMQKFAEDMKPRLA